MADNPLLITNTDISGVLKNVYTGFRVNCFPIATRLLAQIQKSGPEKVKWGGNGVYGDAVLTRPVGFNASDSGYFSTTAAAVEKQFNLGIKRTYVTRQIDMLADYGTMSKEAAFVSLGKKIAKEALDAARLGQQEVLHGDGRAIKGIISTATTSTSWVVYRPYGITGGGQGGLLLDVGMYIAAVSTAGVVRGRATITAITNSGDNATITLDTAIASGIATDFIVSCSPSDTSYNSFPNGLTNITNRDNSTWNSFEGITSASYARWNSTQFTAGTDTDSANEVSEMDIWKLATTVEGKSGKSLSETPDEFIMLGTPGIERRLAESFLGQRRFEAPLTTIKGGFKAVQVLGSAFIKDPYCPAGTMYLLHTPSLLWVDQMDFTRVQYEDSGAVRFISGRDAFEFTYKSYWNFGASQRNSHGILISVTDTDRYGPVM